MKIIIGLIVFAMFYLCWLIWNWRKGPGELPGIGKDGGWE